MGQERCRDALWLPATSSFASCGKRSRAERQTWPARRGSSFPAGRSKTTSFLSSRCTPFVTFCNFKCSDCVNHVQFFPTNAEEFPESGNAFTERFISESRRGLPYPRRRHHERAGQPITSGPCTGVFDSRFRRIGRSSIVAASTRVSRGAVVEKNEWTLVRRIGRRIVLTGLVRQWVAAWTATATGRS